MKLALVHSAGPLGDGLRVEALRRFAEQQGVECLEVRIHREVPPVDLVREALTPAGLRNFARKVVDRRHPLLRRLNENVLIRRFEADVRRGTTQVEALGADLFQAEGVREAIACRRAGRRYLFDMHGLEADEIAMESSRELALRWAEWEREAVEGAWRVSVVTEGIREEVCRRFGRRREHVLLCPNGTELSPQRASHALPLRVVYAGNFAPLENVLEFVAMAEAAGSTPHRFVLLGDGRQRDEIFARWNRTSAEISYLGRRSHARAREILAGCQVGVLAQRGDTALTGSPLKLFEYAACGLPVLAGPGAWADLFERHGCGVVAPSATGPAFAEALSCFTEPETWRAMSEGARKMVEDGHLWSQTLAPLAALLQA